MNARPRIYLDNAATSLKKPKAVADAIGEYLTGTGACAGRGAYREATHTAALIHQARQRFCRLINGRSADHVIFTLNGSDALNLAIKGVLRPGDHVVSTAMDHNSVLRPLHALQQRWGIDVTFVAADSAGRVRVDDVRSALRPQTRLVAVVHASNVTGTLQPIGDIGSICKERGVIYLVDAAQSCGHVAIDVEAMHIDLLASPGHKGLLGPSGTGVLYLRPGMEDQLQTLREGGTGSRSELATQPLALPDKYEPGSHNALGLVGLNASLEWLLGERVARLRAHDEALCELFFDQLAGTPGLKVFGPTDVRERVGVFSVRLDGWEPADLSAALEASFGVLTRSGLHCAPYAHRTIGTLDRGGTTRLSFGALTTTDDVIAAARALRALAGEPTTDEPENSGEPPAAEDVNDSALAGATKG